MTEEAQKKEKTRLFDEAMILLGQSSIPAEEKENLKRNIEHFLSMVSKDTFVAKSTWAWFDKGEDGYGIDLKWEWKDVKGVFGFYADNGHGFSFAFGESGEHTMCGGDGGECGFSCGVFIHDLESNLTHMGY